MGQTAFFIADFARVTEAAFGFLAKHGYTALPAERGGRFGSGYVRKFRRGSCEIAVLFGDVDSHHLCSVFFRDDLGQAITERHYMGRGLVALLAERAPAFIHPTLADLSTGRTPEDVVAQYGEALRTHALDVVEGDFSAFPVLLYVLHHVDRKFPGGAVRRFLGVYSTYELTVAAIEERTPKPGYVERQDGFEIWRVQKDGHGSWFAGIPLDDPRETRG